MAPFILGVPAYPATLLCAVILGVALAVMQRRTLNQPAGRAALFFVTIAAIAVLGARLFHLIGRYGYVAGPYDVLHVWDGGLRAPGGFVAAIIGIVLIGPLVFRGVELRRVLDVMVYPLAGAYAVIPIACFLRGCCFGEETSLPWGLAFPKGSPAYEYQALFNGVLSIADESRVVHPLQLYMAMMPIAALAVASAVRRGVGGVPGATFAAFVLVQEFGKACLETLRADRRYEAAYLVETSVWLAVAAAIVFAALLIQARGGQVMLARSAR